MSLHGWRCGLCLFLAASIGGCRTVQQPEFTQSGTTDFERFHAEYEFEHPVRQLKRSFDSDPDSIMDAAVQRVSWNDDWTLGRLEIECPHPSGHVNIARLRLLLLHDDPDRLPHQETRLLAIPRQQVDLLILDLSRSGFFDEKLTVADDSNLKIELDQSRVDRAWMLDGRLLDFAHRTLTRGLLIEESVDRTMDSGASEAGRGVRR